MERVDAMVGARVPALGEQRHRVQVVVDPDESFHDVADDEALDPGRGTVPVESCRLAERADAQHVLRRGRGLDRRACQKRQGKDGERPEAA